MKKTILLLLLIGTFLVSCKKETLSEEKVSTQTISKLKDWYNKQKNVKPSSSNLDEPEIPSGEPNWDEASYFSSANLYKIPFDVEVVNPQVDQYLLIHFNGDGEITSGEFAFIHLKDVEGNLTRDQLPSLFPKLASFDDMPDVLQASMIRFSLNGDQIDSKKVENSIVTVTDESLKMVEKNTPNNTCENPVCTDWYWTTWENGVVINETYLYTTCACPNITTGGGSGGSGTGTSSCEVTCNNFVAMGHPVAINIGETLVNSGPVFEKVIYSWKAYSAGTWGILSYEEATIKKEPATGGGGIIRTFYSAMHKNTAAFGANIGGTRTFQEIAHVINVSPTRFSVQLELAVSSSCNCPMPTVTIPASTGTFFVLKNHITYN